MSNTVSIEPIGVDARSGSSPQYYVTLLCSCSACSNFRFRCTRAVVNNYISTYTNLVNTPQVSIIYSNNHAVISTPAPNFSNLIDEAILREDTSLAQSPPSPITAPHSFTQYPDMLLINKLGETVTRLPMASRKRHNIVLLFRRCADCKPKHTEMDCPFLHVERELVL
jgi:hypothetical protein